MDSVEPLVAAVRHSVRPFIQEAISSSGVTSIIRTSQHPTGVLQSTWIPRDSKVIWIFGGIAVGFYFGFRVGVVSGRLFGAR